MRTLFKALAAFALTLFIAACSGSGTPEKTAEQFIRNAYNGNGDAVVAMLYIPADAKPGEKEMVEGKMRSSAAEVKAKAEARGGVKNITAEPAEIDQQDPNRARVKLTIEFGNGESTTDRVRLIKIDGNWKVQVF
ncbi:DUF4878 domain-containing protein [Eikenella corrodens]|uniref:DUF4878 domain-containing protein n=1 Tax=Eikenella corrodens CC92I TaxID=1073362 RepID=V7IBQ7_EIKCO|nr:DUF4878 domain-containing protein [Eikenella corrodens]ETA83303.1 hypothetical protein HMPREF1177_01464 [Eikenella corrodens CC92I]